MFLQWFVLVGRLCPVYELWLPVFIHCFCLEFLQGQAHRQRFFVESDIFVPYVYSIDLNLEIVNYFRKHIHKKPFFLLISILGLFICARLKLLQSNKLMQLRHRMIQNLFLKKFQTVLPLQQFIPSRLLQGSNDEVQATRFKLYGRGTESIPGDF